MALQNLLQQTKLVPQTHVELTRPASYRLLQPAVGARRGWKSSETGEAFERLHIKDPRSVRNNILGEVENVEDELSATKI